MKKTICNKKILIIAQAAFALLVFLSMFFCFSYYSWSNVIYKTSGFELLMDYKAFGIGIIASLVLCAIIIIVSFFWLSNTKIIRRNFCFLNVAISLAVFAWSIIMFVFVRGSVMVDAIDGGGESKIIKGAGLYMYLIFSLLMFVASMLELLFYNFKKINKENC